MGSGEWVVGSGQLGLLEEEFTLRRGGAKGAEMKKGFDISLRAWRLGGSA